MEKKVTSDVDGEDSSSEEDDEKELEKMYGMGRNNNKAVKVVHNARQMAAVAARVEAKK